MKRPSTPIWFSRPSQPALKTNTVANGISRAPHQAYKALQDDTQVDNTHKTHKTSQSIIQRVLSALSRKLRTLRVNSPFAPTATTSDDCLLSPTVVDMQWLRAVCKSTVMVERNRLLDERLHGSSEEQAMRLTSWLTGPFRRQQFVALYLLFHFLSDVQRRFDQTSIDRNTVFEEDAVPEHDTMDKVALLHALLLPSTTREAKAQAFQSFFSAYPEEQARSLLGMACDDSCVLLATVHYLIDEFKGGADIAQLVATQADSTRIRHEMSQRQSQYTVSGNQWVCANTWFVHV